MHTNLQLHGCTLKFLLFFRENYTYNAKTDALRSGRKDRMMIYFQTGNDLAKDFFCLFIFFCLGISNFYFCSNFLSWCCYPLFIIFLLVSAQLTKLYLYPVSSSYSAKFWPYYHYIFCSILWEGKMVFFILCFSFFFCAFFKETVATIEIERKESLSTASGGFLFCLLHSGTYFTSCTFFKHRIMVFYVAIRFFRDWFF